MPPLPEGPPFDPDALAVITARAKRHLRSRMRALRLSLPPATVGERSRAVVERLLGLDAYARARRIASYAPMLGRGEVDLSALFVAARRDEKEVFFPYIDDPASPDEAPRLGFRAVRALDELVERGHGFPEPPPDAPEAEGLDLVAVPALAVDTALRRLGQGSGFYDRVLPRFCPPGAAVATVFDFQLLGELPAEEHDARCDTVVTDARVIEGPASQPR